MSYDADCFNSCAAHTTKIYSANQKNPSEDGQSAARRKHTCLHRQHILQPTIESAK